MTSKLIATNHYVHVKRDDVKAEQGGLLIPGKGQVKPHTGLILSTGSKVRDARIKAGRRAVWHGTVGQEIEFEGETILILEDIHIIGVV